MLHFGKIPEKLVKFGENSAKFWQSFGKNCEILEKNRNNSANFNEKIEIRERSSPSRASRPCCSRLSRGPPRYSRLRRPPLCPRPLRAPSLSGAPSGVLRSSCPVVPALRLSLDRCLQAASGFCLFVKFSSRVQGSTRVAFSCVFADLVTSPLG